MKALIAAVLLAFVLQSGVFAADPPTNDSIVIPESTATLLVNPFYDGTPNWVFDLPLAGPRYGRDGEFFY